MDENGKAVLIVALYVDDGLVCSNNVKLLKEVVDYLSANCFVGLEINRDSTQKIMWIHQLCYIRKMLEKFGMNDAKDVSTPIENNLTYCKNGLHNGPTEKAIDVPYREALGSLLYISNGTRPDITYPVNKLASYSEELKMSH